MSSRMRLSRTDDELVVRPSRRCRCWVLPPAAVDCVSAAQGSPADMLPAELRDVRHDPGCDCDDVAGSAVHPTQ